MLLLSFYVSMGVCRRFAFFPVQEEPIPYCKYPRPCLFRGLLGGRDQSVSWGKLPAHGRAACTCSRRALRWALMGSRGLDDQLRHLLLLVFILKQY